jgi:uncharacterized SAM-binding protein YcdF (DUF218 family)
MNRRRIGAAVAVVLILLIGFALSRAGTSLSVSDPLQPADAIVVINGRIPWRAMKGADLYKQRLAPEVWLTVGNRSRAEVEMEKIDVHPPLEHVYSQQVLEKMGVPPNVIHVIPARNNNTATEMKTIAAYARQHGTKRVILVTSSYHSRRVRSLWHQLVGDSPQAIVQYTQAEPFNAGRWWKDTADAWTVSREWFGLLNAWLGFPLKSEHW